MNRQARRIRGTEETVPKARTVLSDIDWPLMLVALLILCVGVVMVGSASLHLSDRQSGQPFSYLIRQSAYALLGITVAIGVWRIPLRLWEKSGGMLVIVSLVMLAALFIPGVGREVNGSVRWIPLGFANLQVSEFAKLFVIVYMAGYLVRRGEELANTWKGFLKPLVLVAVFGVLFLLQPDFGATAVLLATVGGMLFLGGVRLTQFASLFMVAVGVFSALIMVAPYRMRRVTSFLDPWEHALDSGFQLTQALIAFGRGEWSGVGLGGSVQKLAYLPEAHTDFLFAVLAEEGGLIATLTIIFLFAFVVWRAFAIARAAQEVNMRFAAGLAWGIGLLIGMQAFVNMGVNMGVLPTKGLALPLMSYGGSSLLANCIAVSLLLRVHFEVRQKNPVENMGRPQWAFV